MNKKSLFIFLLFNVVLLNNAWSGTITFADLGLENGVQYSDPFDGGDFTVTFVGGTNNGKYYNTGEGIRVYGNGQMVVEAKSGNLTKIVVTFASGNDYRPAAGDVVDTGTFDPESGIWTGNASKVTFTRPSGSGHWRVQKVKTDDIIEFADPKTKEICVANWDTNGDGELSTSEAAAVDDGIGTFAGTDITSFDEFQYFTGITEIVYNGNSFRGCANLKSIIIPNSVELISGEPIGDGDGLKIGGPFEGCSSLTNIVLPNSLLEIGSGAFYGCTGLQEISIPSSVKQLGTDDFFDYVGHKDNLGVFQGCSNLTKVNLPTSGIIIGDNTFKDCTSLQTIYLPGGVALSGDFIFSGCKNLKSVNLDGIIGLNAGTFYGCKSLTSINLPSSLKYLESVSYSNHYNINRIVGVFEGCSGLKSVVIPNSMENIGVSAFKDCTGLTSVTIPNSVTRIEDYAFYGCSNLTAIDLPNSINTICIGAFAKSGLKSISLPNSLTSICTTSFDCYDLYINERIPEGYGLFHYLPEECGSFESCKDLESVTGGDNLKNINFFAFSNTGLKNIDFTKNAKTIGQAAFSYCKNLTILDIPSSIEKIGEGAFYECENLTSVTIPSSVKYLDSRDNDWDVYEDFVLYGPRGILPPSFSECPKLTNVTVDIAEPLIINEYNFSNRANAYLHVPKGSVASYQKADYWKEFKQIMEISENIVFEDDKTKALCVENWDVDGNGELSEYEATTVTSIGTVFKGAQISSFNELRYFTGLTVIGNDAFNACSLKSVTLPENITALGDYAFLKCNNLTSIHLPAKVKTLGKSAFSSCSSITSITVDESNETFCSIDGVLFTKDKTTLIQFPLAKTDKYTVPDGTIVIDRDAFYKSKLVTLTLPTSLKEIGYDAFGYSSNLTELIIPEGVTTIGDYIADHCTSLTTLRIPSTVTSIGQRICNSCNSITDVYSDITIPYDINSNNFTSTVYSNATLHIPFGTRKAYANATGWKEFKILEEMEGEYPAYAILSTDKTTLTFYKDGEMENREGTNYGISLENELPEWYSMRTSVKNVVFDMSFSDARPSSLSRWFYGMSKLETIEGIEYLNTSEVTDMSEMFQDCGKLRRVDLTHFDTSIVQDISYMFNGCTSMASLDFSNFTLADGTATTALMRNCSSLKTLKVSKSFANIDAASCKGVGTSIDPCILIAPEGFNFGVNSTGTFIWKSGYFRTIDEPVVYAPETTFSSGMSKDINICLKNGSEPYNGYQFDIVLPDGFEFITNQLGTIDYTLGGRYTDSPNVTTSKIGDNTYRIIAYLQPDQYITGSDGTIISLKVKANDELSEGTWVAKLTNIFASLMNNTSIMCVDNTFNLVIDNEEHFILGDANHDGYINMSDVTTIINYILGKRPTPFYFNEADVNKDGFINVSDVTTIINIILGKHVSSTPANCMKSILDQMLIQQSKDGYDIILKNDTEYTACEITLKLPEGSELRAVSMDYERMEAHKVLLNDLGNGFYRIVIYSSDNATMGIGCSRMMHLRVDGPLGEDVRLLDNLYVDTQMNTIILPDIIGTTTGIAEITSDKKDEPSYNLQGIPIRENTRGIHVRKGSKFVVK